MSKMVADRRKRSKLAGKGEGEDLGQVDEKLVVHIEKLQEVQDELEKVLTSLPISVVFLHGY